MKQTPPPVLSPTSSQLQLSPPPPPSPSPVQAFAQISIPIPIQYPSSKIIRKNGLKYKSAFVIIFNSESVLLHLRKGSCEDPLQNKWGVPGGECDEEDDSQFITVCRELEEESGIKILYTKLLLFKETDNSMWFYYIWDNTEIARLEGYGGKELFYESIGLFVEENQKIIIKKPEGSRGPMDVWGGQNPPPEGVINSRDLFQHMYKTAEEALKASEWFGCGDNIHYHKDEKVWMPCSMN